ncbi:E3 UFM1-protein ligase 1 [Dissophora globulifera]|uniref:E3 UFM1-protein ligase 1 n=1 Tax=Dissophora globulifera TaxID=979702 RepID=A0A9P6RWK6_9FUNG|nr:E3 UFM1-protein ligase 1 [Dissophora globulifera]
MVRALWDTLFGIRDSPEDLQGPASLSEEACGDLVHSLVRLGFLTNMAHSLDGKSFITHEQLAKDILLQLDKHNGRVSLLNLPRTINADLADIQDRVQDLIRQRPGQFVQVQDELLKTEYLVLLVEKLNQELIRDGYLVISDMCRKHKFGVDFMRQFLKDRVGNTIAGQWDTVDRGLVIAPTFLAEQKAILRKTLSALDEPTSLNSLRGRHVVQDQLFYGLCDLVAKENDLPGVFRGTGDQGVFVPRPYEQQQIDWIETFFRNNGFIELDAVKKRGVADPKAHIQSNHPSALLLEVHAVKESIWSIIDASVEDTISNLSWIDVKPLLPSPLTKGDISSLLRQLPSLKEPTSRIAIAPDQDHSLTGLGGGSPQETLVIQDTIVVTSGQLQKCLLRMGPLLDRSLKNLVSWRLSHELGEHMDGQDDGENTASIIGEGGVSTLKGFLEHAMSSQTMQRKGSGNNNSNNKGKNASRKSEGKKKTQIQDFLTIQEVKDEIRQIEPDFDPALVNAVAGILHRDLVQNLKDRNRSVILNQVQDEEQQDEEAIEEGANAKDVVSDIRLLSKRIELSSKGIDVFEDSTVKNSLSKYLLQSWCVELLDLVVLRLAMLDATPAPALTDVTAVRERLRKSFMEHHHRMGGSTSEHQSFAIAAEDATALLKLVPPVALDPLKRLRKLTAGSGKQKNMAEYMEVWSALSQDPKLEFDIAGDSDVKDDRQLEAEHMQELGQILAAIKPHSDPALMLHIVALIAFQKWTGRMLHASGKYVPRILRQLRLLHKDETATEQLDLLDKMLNAVLSNVKQQQQQQQGEEQSGDVTQEDPDQLWQAVHDLGVLLSTPQ